MGSTHRFEGEAISPADESGKMQLPDASVSRRSFIELSVGALAVLPAVAGGFALPFSPVQAFAADTRANTAKVVIAKSYEAGVVVADMVSGRKVPVPDAAVTITSHYNKKKVSGKTNGSGVYMADIRDLAKKENVNGVDRYSFDAEIEVSCAGYRRFHARRISVEGARGLLIPTRKLGGEPLYPSGVSFDDWDVLYTKNEFCVSPANDVKHTLVVEITCDKPDPLDVKLVHVGWDDGVQTTVLSKTGVSVSKNLALMEVNDYLLLQNHASALPFGSQYHLEITQNDTTYKVPIGLSACASPRNATQPGSTKLTLAPFDTANMKPQIEVPKSVPLIGGDKLAVWTPDLPVEIMFNPFGYFKIAYKSEDWGYKSKDGKPDPNAWKSHPRKTFAQQWKDASDARDKMMKSVGDAWRREGVFKKADFTSNLSATLNLSFMMAGRWGQDSGVWRGQLGVQIVLAFAYSYAQQFMAGPIPLVVEFGINSSLTIGMVVGVMTPEITSPSKYSLDYGSSGVSMTIVIAPTISLGVGVKGVLSASIQGLASFTLFVQCINIPYGWPSEMTNPHYVLGIKAQANVVVQAFIFTATHTLWEWNKPAFYDSWKSGLQSQSDLAAQADEGATGGGSWDTIFGNADDIDIIPVEAIAENAEFDLMWEDVDVSEYGEDWESKIDEYDEGNGNEGWICWGEGLVGGGGWGDPDDADDGSFWYIVNEDGSVSGGGSWDGGEITGQSVQEDAPASSPKLIERVTEHTTEDGIPYKVTSFEFAPATTAETQGDAVAPDSDGSNPLMAGSSPALGAQNAGDDRITAQSTNMLRRGKVVRKSGKIADGTTMLSRPGAASPARLAFDTGLVPQCDKKIIEGVFSDPRAKVIKVFDRTYLLRIAAVDIKGRDGQTLNRTRIVAQQLVAQGQEAQPAFVLDFKHTFGEGVDGLQQLMRRDELYDYDFAVLKSDERAGYCNIDLFIISGRRPNGNNTTIGQAASDQVFTHAVCRAAHKDTRVAKLKIKYGLSTKTSAPAFNATGKPNLAYHCFSCPQLVETAEGELIATYLDRAADSPDKVLTDQASVGLGLCFSNTYLGNLKAVDVSGFVNNTDSTVYDMTMLKPVKKEMRDGGVCRTHIPISLQGKNETSFYILTTDMKSKQTGTYDPNYVPQVRFMAKADVLDAKSQKRPDRIVNWPGHEPYVLASIDGKLMKGALQSYDTSSPSFNWEEAGPAGFSISNFGTDATGNFIYWPATFEGSPGFSYEGTADNPENAPSLPEIERHNVMACKLRKGSFSDPFVFAEVNHDMDTLQVIGSQKSEAMAFISSDLRDVKKGKADIWYTSMPNAKCANVIGVEAVSEIVHPGEPATFDVTVRNDGNTYLSGFTAQLVEKGSRTSLADVKLTFSKDTLVESGYNPADDKGALLNVEDDYTLAPGKTSVYQIKFIIPGTWKGEKSVSVLAKDAVVSPSGSGSLSTHSLSPQAEGDDYSFDDSDAVEYLVGDSDGDFGDEGMPFDLVDARIEDNLDEYVEGYDDLLEDAPVEELGENGETQAATTKPAPAKTIPNMSDNNGPLTGLLGATAAAGAAMAAYSARRVANERGESEGKP
jgi:hypothetical protein